MGKMSKEGKRSSDSVAELIAKEEREPIASFLKMRILELNSGYAKVAIKLVPEYQNFQMGVPAEVRQEVDNVVFIGHQNS